jgi:hypothetical protein
MKTTSGMDFLKAASLKTASWISVPSKTVIKTFRRQQRCVLTAVLGLLVSGCMPSTPSGLFADTVYRSGVVVTMNDQDEVVEAVAVRGELIVGVGTDEQISALVGPATRVVELDGRTMVPGFYAAHDHFPGSGRAAVSSVDLNSPPIGAVETMDQLVLRCGSERMRRHPASGSRDAAMTTLCSPSVDTRRETTLTASRRNIPSTSATLRVTWVWPTVAPSSWLVSLPRRQTLRGASYEKTLRPANRTAFLKRAGVWSAA